VNELLFVALTRFVDDMIYRHDKYEEFIFHTWWAEAGLEEVQGTAGWCPASCGLLYFL